MKVWGIITLRATMLQVLWFLFTCSVDRVIVHYVHYAVSVPSLSFSKLLSWKLFLRAVPDGGTDPWSQQNIVLLGIIMAGFFYPSLQFVFSVFSPVCAMQLYLSQFLFLKNLPEVSTDSGLLSLFYFTFEVFVAQKSVSVWFSWLHMHDTSV